MTAEALRQAGLEPEWVAWDCADVTWSNYEAAVVRSTWNYYENIRSFTSWIAHASAQTRLLNPQHLLTTNLHKRYLLDLEAAGVPIVPTVFVSEDSPSLDRIVEGMGWSKVVVKPAVSAGSFMTESFTDWSGAQRHLEAILRNGDAMIQPYIEEVNEGGEANFIHIGGSLTHGIVKSPRFSTDEESVTEAIQPSEEQRLVCEKAMAAISGRPTYARVDLMRSRDQWLVSELELIEPSLFFLQYP